MFDEFDSFLVYLAKQRFDQKVEDPLKVCLLVLFWGQIEMDLGDTKQ